MQFSLNNRTVEVRNVLLPLEFMLPIFTVERLVGIAPEFTEPLKPVMQREGQSVTFECHVKGLPEPTVEWQKDGHPVFESSNNRITRKEEVCQLVVSNLSKRDEGIYQCIANNEVGRAVTSADLHIVEKVPAPEFIKRLRKVEVFEGDDVVLDTITQGNTVSDVEWYCGKKHIQHGGRYEIISDKYGGRFSLTIRGCKMDDANEYSCVAKNESGKDSCSGDLAVKEKLIAPQFAGGDFGPFNVNEGDELKVKLRISGKPEPKVTWFKNNEELFDSNLYKIFREGDWYYLVIKHASLDHTGVYRVCASSTAGTVDRNFNVKGNCFKCM